MKLGKLYLYYNSLYQSKQITKKVCNNIIKSIQERIKMDAIFMNSENSRTPKPHLFIKRCLKLTNKLDLRIGKNVIALSNYLLHMEKYKKFI